jgi:hypothetical protein
MKTSQNTIADYSYKIAIIVLYLAVFLLLPSYFFKSIICAKTSVVLRDKAFYQLTSPIKILVVGDSHNMKILKTDMSKGIFNFATGGENYMQTYYKLKKALKQNNQIKTIIIPLNINSFAKNNFSEKSHLYYWNDYIDYIELLKLDHNYREHLRNYILGTFFPYIGKGEVVTNYFGGKKLDEEKMLKASEEENKDFSQLDENEQVLKAQKRVKELFPEGNENKVLEIYFHKLIALCKSKNLEIIVLTLPMTDAFMNSYKAQYDLQGFETKRHETQLQYPELQFMDLRGELSAQHFSDSDHLNLSGAQVADNYIRKKLSRD